jgi:glycosyltransferase involved in cell wall biosynthesis
MMQPSAGRAECVTIGLACYNAQDTIVRALNSALAQDWPHTEIIIVDDCSSDGSVSMVKKAIADHHQARLIQHKHNLGPAGTRNTILNNARGEYVVFFDDDDVSLPARITGQVQTLQSYEEQTGTSHVACYASGVRRYPNGYEKFLPAIGSQGTAPHGPELADYLLFFKKRSDWFYGGGVPACALLARRSTFVVVGGFDPVLRRVEDADFAIRLAFLGGHFIGTGQILFTQYATWASDKSPEKNLEAEQYLAEKNKAYLSSVGHYEYARRWPKLRYWHFKRRYASFILELSQLLVRYPLAVTAHLFHSGPRRLWHERLMRQEHRK